MALFSQAAATVPTVRLVSRTLLRAGGAALRRSWRHATRQPRKLRVGVDIRPFYEPLTGIGWYLWFLVQELSKRDDVELVLIGDARVTDDGPHFHAELPPNAELLVFDLRGRGATRFDRPVTAAAYVAWIALSGCDVIFGANYFLPRLMAAVARRRVVTVHDLTFRRFPELLQKETLDYLDMLMTRELAQSDAVICVSESTRRDLLEFYSVDPGRVFAIHSGLEALEAAPLTRTLPERYLLFVSTIEPRKNLGVLLDAFESLRDRGAYDGELVIVGRVGWKSEEVVRRMRTSRWKAAIHHLDYVKAGELASIYRHADVFVFPSIYEGFGFPLLEAMAHGTPTVSARSSSLPEIGGDAALYFDPKSATDLAAAIERVTSDAALRAELVARGRSRAAQFRWSEAAEKTLGVLRRAAE